MNRPGILMVTGAYLPELSGGGLQARNVIKALGGAFDFSVLTTCVDPGLPLQDRVEGVRVTRIFVDVRRPLTKLSAAWQTIRFFLRSRRSFEIVHLHGFSQKSVLVALLARALGKQIIITIHTADQDDPAGVRRLGLPAYWTYTGADRFVAISERMARNYLDDDLPRARLRIAPNGVDTDRFTPVDASARAALRRSLADLPPDIPWILFVGFFSADKRPDVVYEAWRQLRAKTGKDSALIYVGATESKYYEVDRALAARIRDDAAATGCGHLVHFAGEVREIERWYQAADVFAMPSTREAFGMALVEAMATQLPVVATRIDGVTDTIVDDGRTGVLVPAGDAAAFTGALERLVALPRPSPMGVAARQAVEERYGLAPSRARWQRIYDELVGKLDMNAS